MRIKDIIGHNRNEKIRNITILFIFCNLVYHLFPVPPVLWRLSLVGLAIYTYSNSIDKTTFERIVFCFLLLDLFYFLFSFAYTNPRTTTIGNTFSAFSTLYIFSFLNKKGVLTDKFFTISAIILFVGCIGYYWHYQTSFLERIGKDEGESATINASSVFLFLIPLLFFVREKIVGGVLLFISLLFIVTAVKRGNIVACVFPIILYVRYFFSTSKMSLVSGSLFFVVVGYAGEYLKNYILDNDFFMYRLQETLEGDSSGRDVIYSNAFNIWYDANIFHSLFGNGYDATLSLLGIHAHNDWLEIMIDFGLIGTLLYFAIFINLSMICLRTKEKLYNYVILSCIYIWSVKTLISMAFTETWMMIMMIPLAIAISSKQKL